MLKLSPCRFCGEKIEVAVQDVTEAWWDCSAQYAVCCGECFAQGPRKDTAAQALAAWNEEVEAMKC